MKKKNLVIIGGGGGGLFCSATVKQLSKEYEVFMISDEDLYCRCSSPYILTKRADLKDAIMPDSMITQFGIKLLKGTAKEIDKKNKTVRYGNEKGTAKISYDKLVFGTGARAFIPPIKGTELKNVFSVRTSEDIKKIQIQMSKAKNALVVGGGVIGVEMAAALRENNIKTSLMMLEETPFERIADKEFRELIEENLKDNKIEILRNSIIKRIVGKNKVEEVIYSKHDKFHTHKADMIIFAAGVRANKELADEIGLKTTNQGILVNDYMQTSDKNIYAVGDVALTRNFVTGEFMPSQLATNAVIQGKVAGKNIAGMKTKYPGHTSAMMVQFLGDEYGSAGVSEEYCKLKSIPHYIAMSHTTDIYQDLKGAHQVLVKLIFHAKTNRIIGVQAYGRNLVWVVNLISYAIMQKSTINDLMNLDYASHPSVSPWPFMDPVVDACDSAMINMSQK